ncbi:motility associated factor glycosyltransferase family protein [Hwanghaeella sp.]|uniref:motility associated factor glycosyltransferase family protein n=1 Tax=Hwanghaeella sp. TaxID=2605943 RepID=UPI003CCC18D0
MGRIIDAVAAGEGGSYRLQGSAARGDLNLCDMNGNPLYRPDALTAAYTQVEDFLRNPTRHLIQPPQPSPMRTLIADRFIGDIYDSVGNKTVGPVPTQDAGGFVCFGLGLGIFLPLVLEAFETRDLIIYETDPNLIYWSLHALPWAGIFRAVEARGGTVTLVANGDPDGAASEIIFALRGANAALVDGSYFMTHLDAPHNRAVRDRVAARSKLLEVSSGFLEDEILMFRNTLDNLKRYDWKLFRDGPKGGLSAPALIVGSGPSVDRAIPLIKQLADRALVFSGGSSLRVLLRHGIVPDFHCELENTTDMADMLAATRSDHDFSDTVLIGGNPIDPRIGEMFRRRLMYFRPATTGARVFSPDAPALQLAAPTAINTAARAAIGFGVTDIWLFGLDLGAREPDRHHSKDSQYYATDDPYWQGGTGMEAIDVPAEANFGGTAYTTPSFQYAQMFFTRLFADAPQCRVLNFSDGVALPGARPARPEDAPLDAPLLDRAGMVADLIDGLPEPDADPLFLEVCVKGYRLALTEWFDRVERELYLAQGTGFLALHARLKPLMQAPGLEEAHTPDIAARYCASGTIDRCMMLGHYLIRRLDRPDRADFFETFLQVLAAHVKDMRWAAMAQFKETE